MHADGSRGAFGHGGTQNNTKNMYKWERRAIFCSARQLQNNKANFGRAKKSNIENNKHNFGQVRHAKVFHRNISKGQVHTVVKKYPEKQNERTQIDTTSRFYNQKKQTQTRAIKSTKNFTNITNQIAFAKLIHIKSQDHKKKQNTANKIAINEQVVPMQTSA